MLAIVGIHVGTHDFCMFLPDSLLSALSQVQSDMMLEMNKRLEDFGYSGGSGEIGMDKHREHREHLAQDTQQIRELEAFGQKWGGLEEWKVWRMWRDVKKWSKFSKLGVDVFSMLKRSHGRNR